MEKDLEELAEKAKTMSEDAQEKLAERLKEMQEKNKDVKKKMDDLQAKGIETWKEIKEFLFDLWNDLLDTYDKELHQTDFEKV